MYGPVWIASSSAFSARLPPKAVHPFKPCRTTSALAGRAYSAAGQVGSALHTMAALQVFQAKLLQAMDESGPDPATFRELRSATDLALLATKTTAQAIGRSMPSLVDHLWLNLTEIKNADRTAFLDSPVSTTGLFGLAVDNFVECFTAAQKSWQVTHHFLTKRSSHKALSTQQPVKSAMLPAQPKSKPKPELQQQRDVGP